jgi:hypothetical protein
VARLTQRQRQELRERCRELLPTPPFTIEVSAWTVTWTKPSA